MNMKFEEQNLFQWISIYAELLKQFIAFLQNKMY